MQATLAKDPATGQLTFQQRRSTLQRMRETEIEEGSSDSGDERSIEYLSTDIISKGVRSVADIQLTVKSLSTLVEEQRQWMEARASRCRSQIKFDPRENCQQIFLLKEQRSAVQHSLIRKLAEKAAGLVYKHLQQPKDSGGLRGINGGNNSSQLISQNNSPAIVPLSAFPESRPHSVNNQLPKRVLKRREKIQEAHEKWKRTVAQCKALHDRESLTKKSISKRLNLKIYQVNKALGLITKNRRNLGTLKRTSVIHHPLHERAKGIIRTFLEEREAMVSSTDIQLALAERGCHKISKASIIKFLKEELGMVYKRCTQIPPAQNLPDCLWERQYAAQVYINSLADGREVLNIDESVITSTDCRKRSWMRSGQKRKITAAQRLNSINIIAATSSKGRILFSINKGRTNQVTFINFLVKLDAHLGKSLPAWKESTLLMLDNASYHRGKNTAIALKAMGVDVLFLGPYQYEMAPVEKFFAFIKSRNLNELRSRVTPKQEQFQLNIIQRKHKIIHQGALHASLIVRLLMGYTIILLMSNWGTQGAFINPELIIPRIRRKSSDSFYSFSVSFNQVGHLPALFCFLRFNQMYAWYAWQLIY